MYDLSLMTCIAHIYHVTPGDKLDLEVMNQ